MVARVWSKRGDLVEALKTVATLVVVLGIVALGLRILHLVPPHLAPEPMRTYATVEEARRVTGLPLYLPAYFPDFLRWPPEEVHGWTEPGPRISVTVILRDSVQPVLWIEEWVYRPGESVPDLPKAAQIVERETVDMGKGVWAEMVSYKVLGAPLYHRLFWDQEDVRVLLTASLPLEELLRMARSMYPPPSY